MPRNYMLRPPLNALERLQAIRAISFYIREDLAATSWNGWMAIDLVAYRFQLIERYMRQVWEDHSMTKNKSSKVAWVGFLDVPILDSEKEKFLLWDVQDHEVWGGLADLVIHGYKVSFGYNKQSDTYVCSLTSSEASCSKPGYTMSSWAKDIYVAARLSLYKHNVMLDCDWQNVTSSPKSDFG